MEKHKRPSYGILIIGILIIVGSYLLLEDKFASTPAIDEKNSEEPTIGVPEPSSTYCIALGYTTELRTHPDGGQWGACIFPDGTECDTWDFFRGKCGQQFTFCEQQGYSIETITEDVSTWTAEYAICIFDDGSECSESEYWEGSCNPSECSKWRLSEGGCISS